MTTRAIIHVDMDAFFAAVEVLDDPSLAGKPVIVGGTPEGRGVVSTASYEARRYGVHSAMPAATAVRLCPQGIFLRPRGRRYHEVSEQIFAVFRTYTPLVEGVSIDEAFLDVTGCQRLFGPAPEIGRTIKGRIRDEIGLTASVGVAPNKFLAKLASDLEKPDGFVVVRQEDAPALLAPLSVGKLLGVGEKTRVRLERMGIRTVADLLAWPRPLLERELGSFAGFLLDLAVGHDDRPVVPDRDPKSFGAEDTFSRDIGDGAALRRELDRLVERVAQRLRKSGFKARTVNLKARYPDFSTVTRSLTLPKAVSQTAAIRSAARELLEVRLERRGRPLRLLGVSVSNLVRVEEIQGTLFPDPAEVRAEKLDHLVDEIQETFGRNVIGRASALEPPDDDSDP